MKKQFENLNNLVELGHVNLNDFYSVTFTDNSINLQGKYNSELVKTYGTFETDRNGFLCARVNICDIEFKITLTD